MYLIFSWIISLRTILINKCVYVLIHSKCVWVCLCVYRAYTSQFFWSTALGFLEFYYPFLHVTFLFCTSFYHECVSQHLLYCIAQSIFLIWMKSTKSYIPPFEWTNSPFSCLCVYVMLMWPIISRYTDKIFFSELERRETNPECFPFGSWGPVGTNVIYLSLSNFKSNSPNVVDTKVTNDSLTLCSSMTQTCFLLLCYVK